MRRMAFPAQFRIKRSSDFDHVYEHGRAVSDSLLKIVAAPNGLSYTRLGLSVGRRFGNAPQRNRFKRLVREAFRLNRESFPSGLDLVVIPRGKPESTEDAAQSLLALVSRIAERLSRTPETQS